MMDPMIKGYIIVFLVSMVPLIELRGAIPYAIVYGLPVLQSYIIAIIGNMIPVPFIIGFARRVLIVLRRKYRSLNSIILRIQNRAKDKGQIIRDYEMAGLVILVAIPLPGTGAWTGALAAALMKLDMKYAVISIAAGVLIAALIVMGITYGVISI